MKPILFAKGETDFTTNGLGRLDCISCKVIEERNGMFELEAEIPVSSAHAGEIEQLSIIGAKAHDGGNIQAFTVYKITKPMNGRFMVYARHLSYRLSDIPCSPFTVAASPQAAANTLAGLKNNALEPCPFNFSTDVTTGNPYTQNVPASIRQRLGGVEGSVLDQFGGEFEFDNWNVKLWKSRGRLSNVTGISLRYGKNITDINQEEEIASTVTGVVPFWIDTDGNNLVTLPEHVVYADNAANYPYHITQVLDLSSEFEEKPTVAQLRGIANTYVHKDGFGVPKVSIKVSFANLWESEEYKDIAPLERVQLCDEVSVYFEKLGISSIAKVVKTDFDVLKERYNNVEVGSLRTTLAQAVTDRDKDIDTTFIQEMTRVSTAITNATAWLTNANGYVVAVKNQDGSWKELLFMNTNDPQTATQGIRFNNNGIGFWNKATDGGNVLDGPYGTAWTIDGRLGDFADKNFWNIRTGDFSLSASATVGGQTVQQIADAAQAAAENTAAAALAAQVAIYDADIADLQNQIDGNVTTWYYSGTPTLNNLPASQWTTTTDKDNHIGDIYYDSATGYAYRFMKDVNNYVWTKISDSDIEAALAEAQDAWDLADNKRRVFITQPVPPYDVGDLWVQGSNGDIKRCATAKTTTQTYSASDWVLASKYTDDSALTAWISDIYASDKTNLQNQIDQRAETWYQATDPSLEWGGCTIKFNSQCVTENSWDYIDIYYKVVSAGVTTYSYIRKSGVFGGQSINIPSKEFWIYWHTDTSVHDFYGWKVDSVEDYTGSDYTTPTATGQSALPAYTKVNTHITNLESSHNPYEDSLDSVYHSILQTVHKGDLWYNTTNNTTWYYGEFGWEQQNVPTAVFDKIDGKAQIFTSQPTPPYNVGDLWCVGTTGDILTCVTARATGNYTATDWAKRNKYTDDTAVNALDNSLNQTEVFNRLIGGDTAQGIVLNNGKLYLRGNYLEAGAITVGGSAYADNPTLVVKDTSNHEVVRLNVIDGIWAQIGTIGNLSLADGELYGNGTYQLSEERTNTCKRTGVSNGYRVVGIFVPKTLYLINSFQISIKYTVSDISIVGSGTNITFELRRSINNLDFTVIESLPITQANGTYDVTFSTTISNTDTNYYSVLLRVPASTTSNNTTCKVTSYGYISNIRKISLSRDGVKGVFIGSAFGIGNFDSVTSPSINTGKLELTDNGIESVDEDAEILTFNKNEIRARESSSKYIRLRNTTPSMSVYKTSTNFINIDANSSNYPTLDIEKDSSNYFKVLVNTKPSIKAFYDSDTYIDIATDTNNNYYLKMSYSSNKYVIFRGNADLYAQLNSTSTYSIAWTSSDRRNKEEIEPLDTELSLNLIDATETKKFKYKDKDGKHYGMIAQDVRELLDNLGEKDAKLEYCINEDDKYNPRNIQYSEYIPHLINYVKDLRAVVDRQQAEIDQLKEIVKKLSV